MLRIEAMDRPKTRHWEIGKFGLLFSTLVAFGCAPVPTSTDFDWAYQLYDEEEIEALFAGTEFRQVREVQDIPEPVQTALRGRSPLPLMANPGEPFNYSDVISRDLAIRRLIFGGRSGGKVFLLFEQGGFAAHVDCRAYEIRADTAHRASIEGCITKSEQAILVYLKHLMQDWPEATRDPVASNPKPGA